MVSEGSDGLLRVQTPSAWQILKGIQELQAQLDELALPVPADELHDPLPLLVSGEETTSESLFSKIVGFFGDLLDITFERGLIKTVRGIFQDVELERGATIKDRATGEQYCVSVENGEVVTYPGTCASLKYVYASLKDEQRRTESVVTSQHHKSLPTYAFVTATS